MNYQVHEYQYIKSQMYHDPAKTIKLLNAKFATILRGNITIRTKYDEQKKV